MFEGFDGRRGELKRICLKKVSESTLYNEGLVLSGKPMKNDSAVAFLIIIVTAFVVMAVMTFSPLEPLLERSILDADEIPGDWKLDPSRSDDASRTFYIGQIPDASLAAIWLNLIQYDNSTAAHQEFAFRESYYSYFISQRPELGDECFLMSANSSSKEFREIYCRVGDILIFSQISFIQEYYLTEEWIFELIQLQIDKVQKSMNIENILIPLPYHSPSY